MNLDALTDAVLSRLGQQKTRAYLIGDAPKDCHNFIYVNEEPYESVVLGVLPPGELLHMPNDIVCKALLAGMPVWLYPHQFHHHAVHARVLCRELNMAEQRLKQLGVRLLGQSAPLITAEMARQMRQNGETQTVGARMTPLARDILEGRTS